MTTKRRTEPAEQEKVAKAVDELLQKDAMPSHDAATDEKPADRKKVPKGR